MSKKDNYVASMISPPTDDKTISKEHKEAMEKADKLEKQVKNLQKLMKDKNMDPITSSRLWERICNYIIEHLDEFLQGNSLGFKFPIRYNFCVFIIPLIPINKVLVFPAFYKFLIPPPIKRIPAIAEFLKSFDKMLNHIKKKSKTEVLVTVYIKRVGSLKEDLEMIKRIPDHVTTKPIKILRWMMEFTAESPGYVH